ncbi:zf-HC2 domain-containing protein [Kiloniella sp. EL199]|uniref:zf-HC2 domain-containing protein n=1 Tax=Kiloniella sp. EL199 TaxID=2107581 RepID=UPI000EA37FA7|nr:zf-HC2 domain-containing protein [Kiloniella sp. EL199]
MKKEIEELLPFYVNGTLEGEELEVVKKALAEDEALREECTFLESMRDEVHNQDLGISPGGFGLKRLQRDLAKEKTAQTQKIPQNDNVKSSVWRIAAFAACIMLLVQTAYVVPLWQQNNDLIAASGGNVAPVRGPVLSVTFVPEAQEENIRELLLAVDARIVDGPSALGIYKLSVPKDPEAVISKLLAHKNLVETVQRDVGESGGK